MSSGRWVDNPPVTSEAPAIETEGLTKRYGRHRGIEDVSFAVQPGEVFGFLGPNGAGKTTTIRTLLDLIHPTSGSARIFGLDSRRESVAIRVRLGNLPGDFGFGRETPGRQAVELLSRLRGVDGGVRAEELARRFRADPDVGWIRSISVRIVVVLPAPLGPRKPNTSPGWTAKLTSSIPR